MRFGAKDDGVSSRMNNSYTSYENGKSCKNEGEKMEKVVKMGSVNCDLVSKWVVR